LEGWILADRGHGLEWARVLRIDLEDAGVFWEAIAIRVLIDPVSCVRPLGIFGLNCEVEMRLTIGRRNAAARTAWHYANSEASPRLVSAYPISNIKGR
jgi:hypothetical protein